MQFRRHPWHDDPTLRREELDDDDDIEDDDDDVDDDAEDDDLEPALEHLEPLPSQQRVEEVDADQDGDDQTEQVRRAHTRSTNSIRA